MQNLHHRMCWVVLFAWAGLCPAAAGEDYVFNVRKPDAGWFGVVQGELRFVTSKAGPGRADYRIWTADHKAGPVSIWCLATKDEPQKFLGWNGAGDVPQQELQLKPQADAWEWHHIGARADTNYAHLQVASGKFKGRRQRTAGDRPDTRQDTREVLPVATRRKARGGLRVCGVRGLEVSSVTVRSGFATGPRLVYIEPTSVHRHSPAVGVFVS